MHGIIYSTAINSNGTGIIGRRDTAGPIYTALVPPQGNPLVLLVFSDPIASGGVINSVSINDSGDGLIGGQGFHEAQPAYVASVSPSGVLTPLTLTGGVAEHGTIFSVAINSSGTGIVGGRDLVGSQPAYAALTSSSGTLTPLVPWLRSTRFFFWHGDPSYTHRKYHNQRVELSWLSIT